jgi:hypothetical protein
MNAAAANRQTEAVFAALAPNLGGVDPVAAGFAAGKRAAQVSVRRQLFAWRAAAAVAFVGMGLSWMVPLTSSLTKTGTPSVHDGRMVQHSSGRPAMASMGSSTTSVLPAESILAIQQAVSNDGLAGLGTPHVPAPSRSVRDADLF